MPTASLERIQSRVIINEFIRSVYNWMAIGLGLTGFVAFYVAHSETMIGLLFQVVGQQLKPTILFYGLIIGELALVFSLAGRIHKMQAATATGLFLLYAAVNGATLSSIFLIYTSSSITSVFFICAATFAACSLYGMVTKRDLTGIGQFMFMGLIGIIIATFVNFFVGSYGLHMIISYIGVLIFVGLTAYDTQKLKTMALTQPADIDAGVVRKGAIVGALTLYLDFILMFQFLLSILGSRE